MKKLQATPIDSDFIDMLKKSDEVYVVEFDKFRIFVFDGNPALLEHYKFEGLILPTLFSVNTFLNSRGKPPIPWLCVDEGAVNPILRGADVMIPGVREKTEFSANAPVCVLEPKKRFAIALGIALVSSSEITPGKKGKCVKVVTRLNDEVWARCLELARKGA